MPRPRKLPEAKELKQGNTFRKRGYRYIVDFRAADGTRVVKLYKHGEKDLAESFAKAELLKIQNHGTETAAILTEKAMREAAACFRRLPKGRTLTQAVDYYLEHLASNESSIPVEDLVETVIATKRREKKSARYIGDLESRLGRFSRDFEGRQVSSITTDEVSEWLVGLKLSPVGQNNYRRLLVLLFNAGKKRKVCRENPAADADKVKEEEGEVSILTLQQAAKLLECAEDDFLPYVAIGLFAGLRQSEIAELDWSEVNFEQGHILVRGPNAKSSRRRYVPMSKNLVQWIKPHAKKSGLVAPQGWDFRKAFGKARTDAGLLDDWDGNELRHSFASYHLALHKDVGRTTQDLGHAQTAVVFRNYRKLVTEAAGKTFFSITPKTAANIVELKTA